MRLLLARRTEDKGSIAGAEGDASGRGRRNICQRTARCSRAVAQYKVMYKGAGGCVAA